MSVHIKMSDYITWKHLRWHLINMQEIFAESNFWKAQQEKKGGTKIVSILKWMNHYFLRSTHKFCE
jgi:hypothetical protein